MTRSDSYRDDWHTSRFVQNGSYERVDHTDDWMRSGLDDYAQFLERGGKSGKVRVRGLLDPGETTLTREQHQRLSA